MKFSTTLILAIIASLFLACSQQDKGPSTPQPAVQTPNPAPATTTTPPANNAVTAGGVQHYTCPNNHPAGGGATAGNCSVCGTALVHNQAFHNQNPTTPPATSTPPANNAVAAGGVQHYTCPNNHPAGGSANAGNCSVCGTALVHNQAFHNQGAATTTTVNPNNPSSVSPLFQTSPGAAQPTLTPPPSVPAAATNAAGVYHYTCTKGCAGGSGSAGTCATCGAALAHNQAYHN